MHLRRLTLKDLGPIESADLMLSPVNLFLGPNEAGKSFLIESIALLRRGSIRGVAVKDNHAFTRGGARGWRIEAVVQPAPDTPTVTLSRTRSQAPDQGTLLGAMGDARVWDALLDARTFLSLKPADRKALVAGLVAHDTEALVDVLVGKQAPADIVEAVREGNLRRAFREAEAARQAIGREIRELEAAEKVGVEDPEVETRSGSRPVSTLPLGAIDASMARARQALREAQALHDAHAREGTILARAAEARKELEGLADAAGWTAEDEGALLEARKQLDQLRADQAARTAEQNRWNRERERFDALATAGGECPTCGQDMTAVKDRARKAALDAAAKAAALGQEREASAKEVLAAEVAVRHLEQAKAAWQRDSATRARLEAAIKAADDLGPVQNLPDLAPLEAEVHRLDAIRTMRLGYEAASQALVARTQRLARLREDYAAAEEVSRCCTPGRMDDEADTLGRLNALVVEYGQDLLAGPVQVTAEWEVTYQERRIEVASDSAQMLVSAVLALALSVLSGVRCLILDRLEAMDDKRRLAFVRLLGRLVERGELATAMLARVASEKPEPIKGPGWLGRFWVEAGSAEPC